MKNMWIIILLALMIVTTCIAMSQNPPEKKKPDEETKTYDKYKMFMFTLDTDTAQTRMRALKQNKNCPLLNPERFRRRVKMLWGIDINNYPKDSFIWFGWVFNLSVKYQTVWGLREVPVIDPTADGPDFYPLPESIYTPIRQYLFFNDSDAFAALKKFSDERRDEETWPGWDILLNIYNSVISTPPRLFTYIDLEVDRSRTDGYHSQYPLCNFINNISTPYRISDVRNDLLDLYISEQQKNGRAFCAFSKDIKNNGLWLGSGFNHNNDDMGLRQFSYTGVHTLYFFEDLVATLPWKEDTKERNIAAHLSFMLKLQQKMINKSVIMFMSGQFDNSQGVSGTYQKIRKTIRANNYYGYTLLREFCENPMREMPTLEKIGTSFRACVKEKNTLLLLEPFADSYDIDTVQPVEFLKACEMGHDDYWFVEVEKPVESPVADEYGYAKILDRTETVYGYILKEQVKVLTDADILQWETMRDKTKSKPGIINDPDGYVNIRKEQSTQSEILGQIKKREVFNYWELPTNWFVVETEAGLRGFVHKTRIKEYVNPEGWTIQGKLTD
jgi:hypothetical protein